MTERGGQSGTPPPKRPTLDELLDRADGAAELQRHAEVNPEVRRHLAVQARLDESMRQLFEPPEIRVPVPQSPSRPALARRLPWAIAAAVLLAVLGCWWIWQRSATGPDVLTPLYREMVAAGFKPETVCTTDAEFANWCRSYMRQPIYPGARREGMELVGWSTTTTIGPVTGVLLARVDNAPVIVVMNRSDRMSLRPKVDTKCSLYVYKKKLGDVVLYEVSPFTQDVILPTLSATPSH